MKKFVEKDVAENPLYHDTWKLLKKYRSNTEHPLRNFWIPSIWPAPI